ncbi:galactose-specific lectin nattectin-like [Scomber japonicus]|uniref:galactose-specific lectin nattectin-like n=1 Tax=Scomber japonicus TaxID=13676 RepID=UPI002305DC14|nr:galactose-specific lectin nattectin-like [Scomber japonicus]
MLAVHARSREEESDSAGESENTTTPVSCQKVIVCQNLICGRGSAHSSPLSVQVHRHYHHHTYHHAYHHAYHHRYHHAYHHRYHHAYHNVHRLGSYHCPSGWTKYGSRCFLVRNYKRTAADAERNCVALGGNLASIHSHRENVFVRNLIYTKCRSYAHAWVGMYDAIQEGKWLWTDGSKVRFTAWSHGEPNNYRQEHCTEVNWKGTNIISLTSKAASLL